MFGYGNVSLSHTRHKLVAPNNAQEELPVVTRSVPLNHLVQCLVVPLQECRLDLHQVHLQGREGMGQCAPPPTQQGTHPHHRRSREDCNQPLPGLLSPTSGWQSLADSTRFASTNQLPPAVAPSSTQPSYLQALLTVLGLGLPWWRPHHCWQRTNMASFSPK